MNIRQNNILWHQTFNDCFNDFHFRMIFKQLQDLENSLTEAKHWKIISENFQTENDELKGLVGIMKSEVASFDIKMQYDISILHEESTCIY